MLIVMALSFLTTRIELKKLGVDDFGYTNRHEASHGCCVSPRNYK